MQEGAGGCGRMRVGASRCRRVQTGRLWRSRCGGPAVVVVLAVVTMVAAVGVAVAAAVMVTTAAVVVALVAVVAVVVWQWRRRWSL